MRSADISLARIQNPNPKLKVNFRIPKSSSIIFGVKKRASDNRTEKANRFHCCMFSHLF